MVVLASQSWARYFSDIPRFLRDVPGNFGDLLGFRANSWLLNYLDVRQCSMELT
jgi:hypothetical protein